jgi:hypothetical protein
MRQVFEKIEFVVGNAEILEKIAEQLAFRIFDERVTEFLSALSGKLLSLREAKKYPDVITFAFWCRKANLTALAEPYKCENRLGRGVAFHIAPSNVPVNFAYTLVTGMLSGNANIVRLPSKDFPQTAMICNAINELVLEFSIISDRLCLVRYGHDSDVTDAISSLCSSRIIWGGDNTVDEIRKSPIPPRANEITFPNRYSICLINADNYLTDYNADKTAKDFFNDTYLTDQNACTSPRIVFWFGEKREKAKEIFWKTLEKLLDTAYELQSVQTVNKLTTFYKFASSSNAKRLPTGNYKLIRVAVSEITRDLPNHFENSGYFYEYDADILEKILPICTRKCQTLSYIGFDADELHNFVIRHSPFGIDRIVPVGKTMDFALIWDGMDLIRTLSRVVA